MWHLNGQACLVVGKHVGAALVVVGFGVAFGVVVGLTQFLQWPGHSRVFHVVWAQYFFVLAALHLLQMLVSFLPLQTLSTCAIMHKQQSCYITGSIIYLFHYFLLAGSFN